MEVPALDIFILGTILTLSLSKCLCYTTGYTSNPWKKLKFWLDFNLDLCIKLWNNRHVFSPAAGGFLWKFSVPKMFMLILISREPPPHPEFNFFADPPPLSFKWNSPYSGIWDILGTENFHKMSPAEGLIQITPMYRHDGLMCRLTVYAHIAIYRSYILCPWLLGFHFWECVVM